MAKFTESLEPDVLDKYVKCGRLTRIAVLMLSLVNQNLPIVLVGVTLSFAVSHSFELSSMVVSDGRAQFIIAALSAFLWLLLSIAQVSFTIRFIVLQNELPAVNNKLRSCLINSAARFLLAKRIEELRRLAAYLVLSAVFVVANLVTMVIRFLDANGLIGSLMRMAE